MPDPRLATLLPRDYGRIYTHPVTREEHVSTTTVLKLWPKKLDRWAAQEAAGEAWDQRQWLLNVTREQAVDALQGAPERSRNKAGTHGSLVHDGCHMMAMRRAGWELTAEQNQKLTAMLLGQQGASVQQALFRFSEFLEKYVKRVLYLEQTVWGNGWAGTFDAIFELYDGRIVLVDYKTGKGIFTEIRLQFASYFYAPIMLNADGVETPMPPLDLCAYLHLPQVGGYSFKDVQITEGDLATFERLLLNWYWNESIPRNFGVAIPIAAALRVPGVHDCGVRKPTARGNPGTIACIRPEGHDGAHHGKDAKTGSRNYHWSDQDVPGADALPPSADGQVPPEPSVQRPVLNVLEGGETDSNRASPLQGSSVPGPATGSGDESTAQGSGGSSPVPAPTPEMWPHLYPPSDSRHVHHIDAGGNCDNPDCTYNSDSAYFAEQDGYRNVAGEVVVPQPELDEAEAQSAKIAQLFLRGPGVEQ